MSLTLINQYLGTIALLIGIANAAWIWLSRPAADIGKRIDKVQEEFEERFDTLLEGQKGHDRRIQRVEDDVRHLPTKDDLNEIATKVVAMGAEVSFMSKVVTRIDEALRNRP